jgi:hypothetical protein
MVRDFDRAQPKSKLTIRILNMPINDWKEKIESVENNLRRLADWL